MEANQMIVRGKIISQNMYYKNHLILGYTIKYPKFVSSTFNALAHKLNTLYRTKAVMYEKSNVMNLYQMAMVDYEYSVANNYPIRQYEAFVTYTVPYNQNCTLSLYFDQYEYTGGAHGITIRSSDNWDLQKSRRMELEDFFPNRDNVKEFITQSVIDQIKSEIATEDAMYFEDYEKLVKDTFKANNFYLTEDGLVIYFQHYDIAPYAAGIRTFTIPYGPGGAMIPRC